MDGFNVCIFASGENDRERERERERERDSKLKKLEEEANTAFRFRYPGYTRMSLGWSGYVFKNK